MKNFFSKLLDLLLPQKCLRCGNSNEILCQKCIICLERCGVNLGNDTFAVFSYTDPVVRKAIRLIKYKGIKAISPALSKFIGEIILEEISESNVMASGEETSKILIIPVPLHLERLKMRGFNQSEVLAKNITEHLNQDEFQLETKSLVRIKNTESQVKKMSRTNRLSNLENAFMVVDNSRIKGKTVMLIDDVITTGATISECRKNLEKAGARKVIALAVAH